MQAEKAAEKINAIISKLSIDEAIAAIQSAKKNLEQRVQKEKEKIEAQIKEINNNL